MEKRHKALQEDEEALTEAWQIVKESVRQLKHDNKRNKILRAVITSSTNVNINKTSSLNDTENNLVDISCELIVVLLSSI